MASLRAREPRNNPATRGWLIGSLAVAALLVAGSTSTVSARGGGHAEAGGEIHATGGRRHGNDSYMKAAAAERDKLLNSKLKSICRGC